MVSEEAKGPEFESQKIHHAARIVGRIIKAEHEVSIFSESSTIILPAYISKMDVDKGTLVLQTSCEESKAKEFFLQEAICLDIKGKDKDGALELLCLENINASHILQRESHLEIQCNLPQSIFTADKRSDFRVPFVQGLWAGVDLEIYKGSLFVSGKLRNLSTGGCMIDVSLRDCAALRTGQVIPNVTIEFPNGDTFQSQGSIRHVRPLGGTNQVALGIQFIELDPAANRQLLYYVNESEREVAYRTGLDSRRSSASALFVSSRKNQNLVSITSQEKVTKLPPMVRGLNEVARQLHITLLFLRNENPFPEDALYDSADTLLYLLEQDRQKLQYALCSMQGEPGWLRTSLQVAGLLGDILLSDPAHADSARDAVAGALIHLMGKPLLLSETLPSLDATLTLSQRETLRTHVDTLGAQLDKVGWTPSPVTADVIFNSNERLDGSGYPRGRRARELSIIARTVALIKTINTITNPRNKRSGYTPIDAYRWVYNRPGQFDRQQLVQYIQRYGFYPVGSLVKFSQGFLAWVMELDNHGHPSRVRVVKNLAFQDISLNTVLTSVDYTQIGHIERVVRPENYQLLPH